MRRNSDAGVLLICLNDQKGEKSAMIIWIINISSWDSQHGEKGSPLQSLNDQNRDKFKMII